MVGILIVVIILFAVGILGAVVKGLLWLTLVCAVLVVAAIGYGYWRSKESTRT